MKKAFVISALIILTLAGCSNASSAESTTEPVSQKFSPFSPTEFFDPQQETESTQPTIHTDGDFTPATEAHAHASSNAVPGSETPSAPVLPIPTEVPQATIPRQEDAPSAPQPQETGTPVLEVPTEPAPAPTEPTPTEPKPTEAPETQPTEPVPTEPAGCQHDWICIHHDAEGHWLAGVRCDCGLEIYGDPEELPELWNTHSASYPPTESLFEHGGYTSADQWVEDKAAYDEWVCRHCGEEKP